MFRFTIRELLLITLIVGMAMGWAIRAWHFGAQLAAKDDEIAAKDRMLLVWENRAEVMVSCLETCDCKARWDDDSIEVTYTAPEGHHTWSVSAPTDPNWPVIERR